MLENYHHYMYLQIKNIDWTAHTYDIYLDGYPIETEVSMWAYGGSNGIMTFYHGVPGSYWIDHIACKWR